LMHFIFPEPAVGLHVSLRNLVTQRAVRSIQPVLRTSYPPFVTRFHLTLFLKSKAENC
jgi:hypothetical protein